MWSIYSNQHVGGAIVKVSKDAFYLLVVAAFLLLAAEVCWYCYRFPNEKDLPLIGDRQLISVLQYEQQSQHTVIGSMVEPSFQFIDMQKGTDIEFVNAPKGDYQQDGNDMHGKEGRIASCNDKVCSVVDSNRNTTTVLFANNHIVTPLQWSPDGRLLLFVRDLATTRLPVRCGFDNEHDVVVYEPETRMELTVTTVCGGYPYKRIGWYVRRKLGEIRGN